MRMSFSADINVLRMRFEPQRLTRSSPVSAVAALHFLSDAGTANSERSRGTFTSIFSMVTVCHDAGWFLGPDAIENGYITPAIGLYEPRSETLSRTDPRMNSWVS